MPCHCRSFDGKSNHAESSVELENGSDSDSKEEPSSKAVPKEDDKVEIDATKKEEEEEETPAHLLPAEIDLAPLMGAIVASVACGNQVRS